MAGSPNPLRPRRDRSVYDSTMLLPLHDDAGSVLVPHVIKGETLIDARIEHRSRATSDLVMTPAIDLDSLIWPRSDPGPAFETPIGEIVDFLAKVQPGATLAETISNVLQRVDRNSPVDLTDRDSLAVPKLNFDLRRDFPELEGLVLKPDASAKIKGPLVISKAEQLVRFQLNEKGAILKSEAVIVMPTGAMAPQFEPPSHQLIFDKPFLLMLRQKGAPQPYLALWIGNMTLLQPKTASN